MDSIKDALLSSFEPDVVVKVNDVEGNERKKAALFQLIRTTLASRYKIVVDIEKDEIYVQYK